MIFLRNPVFAFAPHYNYSLQIIFNYVILFSMNRNLSQILSEISALELSEKLRLLELIIHNINLSSEQQYLDWISLYGSGKEIWEDEDAQEYVNNLREDRQ